MKDLAEEPFRGIGPAALGQVLRVISGGQLGDFGGFSKGGVVLPQPGLGVEVFLKLLAWKAKGKPFLSTGSGVEPVVSTPSPIICSALKL